MTPHSLYQIKATRHGQSITLNFVDVDLMTDTARELRRRGYETDCHTHGFRIEQEIRSALNTAHLATRRMGEPLESPVAA